MPEMNTCCSSRGGLRFVCQEEICCPLVKERPPTVRQGEIFNRSSREDIPFVRRGDTYSRCHTPFMLAKNVSKYRLRLTTIRMADVTLVLTIIKKGMKTLHAMSNTSFGRLNIPAIRVRRTERLNLACNTQQPVLDTAKLWQNRDNNNKNCHRYEYKIAR